MVSKLFLGIAVMTFSFGACDSNGTGNGLTTNDPKAVCKSFIKAICTKDTASFYQLVDKEKLTTSMNEWINDGKKLTQNDVFFPFFFVYGPLKIRYEDLLKERKKEAFFTEVNFEKEQLLDKATLTISVKWLQNTADATMQDIELQLKEKDGWKIAGAKWKT